MSRAFAPAFFCPYCGEEDIRPAEDAGTYRCSSCTRTYRLSLLVPTTPQPGDAHPGAAPPAGGNR